MPGVDLAAAVGPLKLKNPVMPASGTYGWAREYEEFYNPSELGAVIPKTITLKSREGNNPQRVVETPAGMLNSIGLQNPGFDAFKEKYWPYIQSLDTVKIVNIAGESITEFTALAERAAGLEGVDALELNISCPNVNMEGKIFGADPERARQLVTAVRKAVDLPLITKLTPNVTDIKEAARAAVDGGTDIISLTNTLLGMAINADTGKPVIGNIRAGLSGPAIKPVALRMVFDVAGAVNIPLIGIGGISSGRDAAEFLMAGASAVQVGTANFTDPRACPRIIEELEGFLQEKGYKGVKDIIGLALKHKN
jgi:dihydroorotate dehydrogenase (NAD+) catalytic subunit